jgi:hypothetical protein
VPRRPHRTNLDRRRLEKAFQLVNEWFDSGKLREIEEDRIPRKR